MAFSSLLIELMDALRILPGVGPKSAQRMAFYLLEKNRTGAGHLVEALRQCLDKVGHCDRCRILSEHPVCSLCQDPERDASQLCIVGSPADVIAIENTGNFIGLYFVLSGYLSPLDGVGPEHIGVDRLIARLDQGQLFEVVLAINSTVEGEATAYFISELAKRRGVRTSRLAQGVPLGGELEYIDGQTLARAFLDRVDL